jgi:hypothetical protein
VQTFGIQILVSLTNSAHHTFLIPFINVIAQGEWKMGLQCRYRILIHSVVDVSINAEIQEIRAKYIYPSVLLSASTCIEIGRTYDSVSEYN